MAMFTPNIPATGQSLGTTKQPIQNNFTTINNTILQDHVPMNGLGGILQGKHNKSAYTVQAKSPGTLTTEIDVYCRAILGVNELFLQKSGLAAAGVDIQMSRGTPITTIYTPTSSGSGSTFLPGGLLLNWGAGNTNIFTFATPFTNPPLSIQVTSLANNASISNFVVVSNTTIPTASGFTIITNVSGLQVFYMAIGI